MLEIDAASSFSKARGWHSVDRAGLPLDYEAGVITGVGAGVDAGAVVELEPDEVEFDVLLAELFAAAGAVSVWLPEDVLFYTGAGVLEFSVEVVFYG